MRVLPLAIKIDYAVVLEYIRPPTPTAATLWWLLATTATLVLLFVLPAIDRMTAKVPEGLRRAKATLAEGRKLKPGRRQFMRGVLEPRQGKYLVRALPDQKSGILRSMVNAEVLINVPANIKILKKGQEVEIYFLK